MKYLYYTGHYTDKYTYRASIIRETEHNYWISRNDVTRKINKKRMYDGGRWNGTSYYEETPELLSAYMKSILRKKFIEKLKELENCEDENIMKQIIKIKLD